MNEVVIGGSLIPSTIDTPLDARGRVATFADIANVEMPARYMTIVVEDTGRVYQVRKLAPKEIGGIMVENACIDITDPDALYDMTSAEEVVEEAKTAASEANAAAASANQVVEEYDTKVSEQDSKISELVKINHGRNYIDPSTLSIGRYCSSQVGGVYRTSSNDTYKVTKLIPVTSGVYSMWALDSSLTWLGGFTRVHTFGEDKVCIRALQSSTTNKITIADDEKYIVLTTFNSFPNLMLVKEDLEIGGSTLSGNYDEYTPIGGYVCSRLSKNAVTKDAISNESVTIKKLSNEVADGIYNAGFRIKGTTTTTYGTISSPKTPINVGLMIKNNSDGTIILMSDTTGTNRYDVPSGGKYVTEFEVNVLKTGNWVGNVDIMIIRPAEIEDNSISTDKLQDSCVLPEKTNFFEERYGKNLFNRNAEGIVGGRYLNSTGGLSSNGNYFITDYIPFTEEMESIIGSRNGENIASSGYIWAYDKNKQPTHSVKEDKGVKIMWEEGDAYVRASFPGYSDYDSYTYQIEAGSTITPYEPFNVRIQLKPEYISKDTLEIKYFFLPKHIYVAAGRTIELYYDQMLLNASQYNIQAKCPIGAALERKFQVIGDEDHIGNYTLSINVYDNNGESLVEATSTIHVVSNVLTDNIKILPIGDSLTNQKPWIAELESLSANKISSVGTRGSVSRPHEGRSGGNVNTYMSTSGNPVYSFDHNYIGVGSDAAEFSSSQAYSVGDYCKYGESVYVFIAAHSAGAWDESHVYNVTEGNPFYDWETQTWSLTKYKQRNNINYDVIMIYLGTNGINLTPETNANGALGIKNLIDRIRLEDANSPIVVVNTIFRSGQNGIGKQGNTDGYSAQSEYKFNADRKVLLLAKALEDMIGDYANVYLCPVGFTHDSKYNFGNIKKAVNPRLAVTEDVYEIYPNESVHPQNAGYMQMADEMFSTICAI